MDELAKYRELALLAAQETARMRERCAAYERSLIVSRLAIASSKRLLQQFEGVANDRCAPSPTLRKANG